jgi:predicted dehydrogenase
MERRTFLAATAASASRIFGANDMIRGVAIGAGGRGKLLIPEFKEVGMEVAGVCDVYEPNLAKGLALASTGARAYDNYKKALDDKSIDVVVIATPEHWHAQMAIDAVEAGKDVYVEKPMAQTTESGFRLVEATRRTKRVVQVGSQRRSSELFQEARGIVRSGSLGDIRLVNSWWLNNQASLRTTKLEGKLDWEQWLGPAPKRPLDPVRFLNWNYFWDYAGGMLAGQGAHVVDAIQWFMDSKCPLAVTSSGGKANLDGAEIPETTTMTMEYPENYFAIFTCGYKAMKYNLFNDQMKQFHGSKARFDMGRESYALYPQSDAVEMKPSTEKKQPGSFGPATRAHVRNFLECVRSRKDPNAPVEAGLATAIALAMSIESLRQGRRIKWDAAQRKMV